MGRHSFPGSGDPSDEPFHTTPEPSYRHDSDADADAGDAGYEDDGHDDGDHGSADPARYLRRQSHGDEAGDGESGDEESLDDDYLDTRWPSLSGFSEMWGEHRDRGHRSVGGRRGVSAGVIAALVTVIVVVGAVILWRFFGNSLSHRSADAAGRCADGGLTVAVVADPSIADHLQEFADRFNQTAKPVGDRCVSVQVKPADSDAVVSGFIGDWPAQLGERPALWIPGSSVSTARLQAAAGHETVSDSRSLVTSPVLLAVRPELKTALQKQSWATLPDLQTNPDALDRLSLPGWGPLRLALPIDGNSDAAFLAGEAVAAASAPKGAPATDGVGALHRLAGAEPKLNDNSLAEAMNVLLRPDNPGAAPVHAVATTEQQVFTRGESLSDATGSLSWWLPPGPVPVADYPTVLLSGSWLSAEQVSAASEFARFAHKPDQLAELAKAGFRVAGVKAPSSDVTDFPEVASTLSVGDDALRATLANALTTPAGASAVTIMLDQSMTTDEGGKSRLARVIAALDQRIRALPPESAVGLWTFDGAEGRSVVSTGPLADLLNGQTRTTALTGELNNMSSTPGGAVSFTTLRLAYNQVLANYRAGQNNSVLVITAGPHTDRSLDGPGLQDVIRQATDPARPVAVDVIAFGTDSDRATWQSVTQLSGGTYQNLTVANSPELATALSTLLN